MKRIVKIAFTKEKIRSIWKKVKEAIFDKYLITGLVLGVLGVLSFIFSETIYRSFLGEILVFLKTNPGRLFLGLMLILAPGVFLFHWRFVGKKTWAWRKIAFVLLWLTAGFVFFEKVGFNLTPYQELVIRNEEQRKFDIILDSVEMDDKRVSRIAEKKTADFKKENLKIKQSFDSLLSVSNAKDQKISSLQGVNKDLLSSNNILDSLNSIKKEPVVIIKENIVPVPVVDTLKAEKSVVGTKKGSTTVKPRKKSTRKHIQWVRYRPPKCY